jgi:hypothetical protein
MKPQQCFVPLAVTILSSGCATSALWENGQFARFHEPATPANLQFFQSGQRGAVLVEYDESREGDDSIRRRAYWLEPFCKPAKNPHKPSFVSVKAARGLSPLPVVDSPAATPSTTAGLHAVVGTNGADFTLRSGERTIGIYDLPVYEDASGKTKQVLLTPLAVAADLTIIGGIAAIYLWPSGCSFSP